MAMRLYQRPEIIEYAKKLKLKSEADSGSHLIFSDENGDPYSVPCPEEGCPDYLFDIFAAKVNKADPKIAGVIQKKYEIEE